MPLSGSQYVYRVKQPILVGLLGVGVPRFRVLGLVSLAWDETSWKGWGRLSSVWHSLEFAFGASAAANPVEKARSKPGSQLL